MSVKGFLTRPKGRNHFYVVVSETDLLTGKRKQRWIATGETDEAKARTLYHQIMAELNAGLHNMDAATATVGDVLTHWLQMRVAGVDPTTADWYTHHVTRHLVPDLGARRLRDLTGRDLTLYYQEKRKRGSLIEGKGLSPTSVGYLHRILSMALGEAVSQGLVRHNVAGDAVLPHTPRKEIEYWLPEESRRFLAVPQEHSPYYLYYATALGTGMRPGEVAALKWRDVRFDESTIIVQRSLRKPRKDRPREKGPKTADGWRRIDIAGALVEMLRAHRNQQSADFVFTQPGTDRPVYPDNIQRGDFRRTIERAGVARITPMGLRHTHATELLMRGVPVGVVSERLGHADEGFTLRQYGHVIPSVQRQAANLLNDLYPTAPN